jgi:hypothetical protein
MDSARSVYSKFLKAIPKTYAELRDFFEKERPDWLQTLMPRRINAPSVYWPQKVLAVATVHAAMHNQVASDVGRKSDPGFSAAEGQGAHLLKFEVPTYYVSEELIAAAARTDLPTDIFLDALPFPFPALVFMFPKGTIRHAVHGECPYLVVSRVERGQVFTIPLRDIRGVTTIDENAVMVSTYLPEENAWYYKTISVIGGETMKSAFERASKIPYLCGDRDEISSFDADFIDRLWLLGMTLVLIMASGESLLETGVRLKTVKPKKDSDKPVEYWSPNYLGRVYTAKAEAGDLGETDRHRRAHWRKGHLKSQAYGPRHSLRRIIWIQPYRTGERDEKVM